VEKPFTIDAQEAETLVALAVEKKLKLTAGHDEQFNHVARRMRAWFKVAIWGGLSSMLRAPGATSLEMQLMPGPS